MATLWLIGLMVVSCSGQLVNDTYGGLTGWVSSAEASSQQRQQQQQIVKWDNLKRYSMNYSSPGEVSNPATALSKFELRDESLSSRMTSGVVGGVKIVLNIVRFIGDFLRKFGAELRVAKCLLMYSLTFQPLSSKVAGGSIQNWLAGYFGAEDARDLYRFLSRNVLAQLGFGAD
uniref:Uncharacterized protein n=1 Tax=Anopheles farauti TaxID=69004 RepID=A0A182QFF6_9DIPT